MQQIPEKTPPDVAAELISVSLDEAVGNDDIFREMRAKSPPSFRQYSYLSLRHLLSLPSLSYILIKKDEEVLAMAAKALNFKMDEADILDMKQVAGVFNMSVTDLIKNAVREYLSELKRDPFYRLTANVQEASSEESQEILANIDALTDDDLSISSAKRFTA